MLIHLEKVIIKGGFMLKMEEIKTKAKDMGLKLGKKNKSELIRSIQTAEGNPACFDTGQSSCKQQDCLWRSMCI